MCIFSVFYQIDPPATPSPPQIAGTDVLTHPDVRSLFHNPGINLHSNGIFPIDMKQQRKGKFSLAVPSALMVLDTIFVTWGKQLG